MVSLAFLLFHSFLSKCFLTQLLFTPPADNLTLNEQLTGPHAAGVNSILPKEHGSQFFYLPIIRHGEEEVSLDLAALLWSKKERSNVLFSDAVHNLTQNVIVICVLISFIPQVSAVCSWDSSIHNSVHLNRVTSSNERIYLIVKATVQLSHPASLELVLRKRIAVNIYNKQVHGGVRFNHI